MEIYISIDGVIRNTIQKFDYHYNEAYLADDVVFEEAQNATPSQIKLLLTRIGFNSKFFISGDLEQSDKYRDKTKSGLYDAKMRLQDVKGIGLFEFGMQDIIRNPIIGEILNRYD